METQSKRGPGRPRKDGQPPIRRKKSVSPPQQIKRDPGGLIGRRLKVSFKIENGSDGWFRGTVASYQPETGFTIKYDDGQVDTGYFTHTSFQCGTEISPFRWLDEPQKVDLERPKVQPIATDHSTDDAFNDRWNGRFGEEISDHEMYDSDGICVNRIEIERIPDPMLEDGYYPEDKPVKEKRNDHVPEEKPVKEKNRRGPEEKPVKEKKKRGRPRKNPIHDGKELKAKQKSLLGKGSEDVKKRKLSTKKSDRKKGSPEKRSKAVIDGILGPKTIVEQMEESASQMKAVVTGQQPKRLPSLSHLEVRKESSPKQISPSQQVVKMEEFKAKAESPKSQVLASPTKQFEEISVPVLGPKEVVESKPCHSPPRLTPHQVEGEAQIHTKENEVNKPILSSPGKSAEIEGLQSDPTSSIQLAPPTMPTELESTEPDQNSNMSGQKDTPQKEDVFMEDINTVAPVKIPNTVGTPEIQVSVPENAVSIDTPKQDLDNPDMPMPREIAQKGGELNEIKNTDPVEVPEDSKPVEETQVDIQATNPAQFTSSGLDQNTSLHSAKRKAISGKEAPTSLLRKRLKKGPSEINSEANDTDKVQTASPTPESQIGSKSLSLPARSGTPKGSLQNKQDTNSFERKANAEEEAKANGKSPGKSTGPVQSKGNVSSHPQPKGSVGESTLTKSGTSPQSGPQSSQAPKRTAGGFLANLLGGRNSSKTTSIGGSTSLSLLPLPSDRPKPKEPSPDLDKGDSEAEDAVLKKTVEELEADVICGKFELQLAGLSKTKESIGKATQTAILAAGLNAAAKVIRTIADAMERTKDGQKRIAMLYLVDSILQQSSKKDKPGCGPDSPAGQAYPRIVSAALTRLVKAVSSTEEGLNKAEKVLKLWFDRKLISQRLLALEIGKFDALREALPPPQLPVPVQRPNSVHQHNANFSQPAPRRGQVVHLTLNPEEATESLGLDNMYGTQHITGFGGTVMKRDDSSDDESDDEETAQEILLRAQAARAKQMARPSQPMPVVHREHKDSDWRETATPPSSPEPEATHNYGHIRQAQHHVGPPGFDSPLVPMGLSPGRFESRGMEQPISIQLNRRPLTGSHTPFPNPGPVRHPPRSGHLAPPIPFSGGWPSMQRNGSSGQFLTDAQDFHGSWRQNPAAQRQSSAGFAYGMTRQESPINSPPLPFDDMGFAPPPLPQESLPPLPPGGEEDQPPLPNEPPPLPPDDLDGFDDGGRAYRQSYLPARSYGASWPMGSNSMHYE